MPGRPPAGPRRDVRAAARRPLSGMAGQNPEQRGRPAQPTPGDLGIEFKGLYDCARVQRELGISRKAAERIMFQIPKQDVPGLRKVYVRGADLQRFLDENLRS